MTASRRAPFPRKRRGVSLVELLIVIAILGIAFSFGLSGLNAILKRQRLNRAAEDVKATAARALTEMQNRNQPTFLVVGKYVADRGTDVAVVLDANGDGTLNETIDPNGDGLFDDAATNIVLWRARVPVDVALSNTGLTAQTFNTQWDRPSSGAASAVLLCDFLGRAVIPSTGAMITGPATVQLSHREMIAGSLTPLVTYTVSIGPLFKTSLARVP